MGVLAYKPHTGGWTSALGWGNQKDLVVYDTYILDRAHTQTVHITGKKRLQQRTKTYGKEAGEKDDIDDNVPFIFVATNGNWEAFALNYVGQQTRSWWSHMEINKSNKCTDTQTASRFKGSQSMMRPCLIMWSQRKYEYTKHTYRRIYDFHHSREKIQDTENT